MRKIIIDCDPGIDDALAIFFALASRDEIEVVGLTCVKGNVALEKTHRNARAICAATRRLDVPVLAGLSRPILATAIGATAHGKDGLGDIGLKAPDVVTSVDVMAVDFIRQQSERHPGEIALCAIGPMTNVAVAMLVDPGLAQRLQSVIFMGGAAFCPGNMNDHAEFNFLADPHAAEIVLQSGAKLVMAGLDVTLQARIEERHILALNQNGNHCSMIAARLLRAYAVGDLHLHDPCAIAWLLDPTLFAGERCSVSVVTQSGAEFGRSVARPDPDGNCLVLTKVDSEKLFALLQSRMAELP